MDLAAALIRSTLAGKGSFRNLQAAINLACDFALHDPLALPAAALTHFLHPTPPSDAAAAQAAAEGSGMEVDPRLLPAGRTSSTGLPPLAAASAHPAKRHKGGGSAHGAAAPTADDTPAAAAATDGQRAQQHTQHARASLRALFVAGLLARLHGDVAAWLRQHAADSVNTTAPTAATGDGAPGSGAAGSPGKPSPLKPSAETAPSQQALITP